MKSFLTLRGVYNYGYSLTPVYDIFTGLKYPGIGVTPTDLMTPDNFNLYILSKSDSFEILYPKLETLNQNLRLWNQSNYAVFAELYKTLSYEYNPIDNYDRTETHTLTETRNLEEKQTGTNTNVMSGTDKTTGTDTRTGSENRDTTDTSNTTTKRAGFNSETTVLGEIADTTGTSEVSVTDSQDITTETNGTSSSNNTLTLNTSNKNTGTITHEETITTRGNIGVTTSQQMIEQQRELVKFNYLNFIVDSLIDNLCLKIY